MNKKIFLDAFFYLAIPLLMWNLFRENFGDYLTILYGMLPAVIYTILVAITEKEWNVTGLFFLSLISLNFLFNLISKTFFSKAGMVFICVLFHFLFICLPF